MPLYGTKVPHYSTLTPWDFPRLASFLHSAYMPRGLTWLCYPQVVCFGVASAPLAPFLWQKIAFTTPDTPQPLPALPILGAAGGSSRYLPNAVQLRLLPS